MEHKSVPAHMRLSQRQALPRERRLNMRLMAFWWDKRANRRFPAPEDFDPEELSDVWTHCFTLRPQESLEESSFQFVGENVGDGSGIEAEQTGGITVGKVRENSLLHYATRKVPDVMTQQVPVIRSGEYVNEAGETIMYRSILLPLSKDQTTVDTIVGGARCKVKRPS